MWDALKRRLGLTPPQPPAKTKAMHRITEHIWQGGYPMDEDFDAMWDVGIRWLFNLDLPYYDIQNLENRGFHVVTEILKDMGKDRPERWWAVLEPLAHADRTLGAGCYVHCNAGASRSPTAVWLHLMLGGMTAEAAEHLVIAGNPHACPGDPAIMDERIISGIRALAQAAGRSTRDTH